MAQLLHGFLQRRGSLANAEEMKKEPLARLLAQTSAGIAGFWQLIQEFVRRVMARAAHKEAIGVVNKPILWPQLGMGVTLPGKIVIMSNLYRPRIPRLNTVFDLSRKWAKATWLWTVN